MTKNEHIKTIDPIECSVQQFNDIYNKIQPSVYRFGHYLTQNHHEAENLYQETWFRVVKNFNKVEKIKNIKAWVFKIMVNLYRDNLRKKRIRKIFFYPYRGKKIHQMNSLDQYSMNHSGTNMDESDQVDLSLALSGAIDNLPINQRQVFLLKEAEGFKHQEISRILKIPVGTTKSLLYRATRQLQKDLEEYRNKQ